jgi:hypothetical protein
VVEGLSPDRDTVVAFVGKVAVRSVEEHHFHIVRSEDVNHSPRAGPEHSSAALEVRRSAQSHKLGLDKILRALVAVWSLVETCFG